MITPAAFAAQFPFALAEFQVQAAGAVEAGMSVLVAAPTGSGKTTLSMLVPRLYDVTAGRVTLDGVDIRELSLVDLRRAIDDEQQSLVTLAEQDRTLWRRGLIEEGIRLVTDALASGGEVGPYQVQAAINAVHDEAPTARAVGASLHSHRAVRPRVCRCPAVWPPVGTTTAHPGRGCPADRRCRSPLRPRVRGRARKTASRPGNPVQSS